MLTKVFIKSGSCGTKATVTAIHIITIVIVISNNTLSGEKSKRDIDVLYEKNAAINIFTNGVSNKV